MKEFAQTLNDLAKVCGKSEYQLAQYSGLDRFYPWHICPFRQRVYRRLKLQDVETPFWGAKRHE